MQGFRRVARRIVHPDSHPLTSAKPNGPDSVFDDVNGRLPHSLSLVVHLWKLRNPSFLAILAYRSGQAQVF